MPIESNPVRPVQARYAPPPTASGPSLSDLIAEMTRADLHEDRLENLTGEIAGLLADVHARAV